MPSGSSGPSQREAVCLHLAARDGAYMGLVPGVGGVSAGAPLSSEKSCDLSKSSLCLLLAPGDTEPPCLCSSQGC